MGDIAFRNMQRNDIARIAELERICFRSPWSESALRGELRNPVAHYRVVTLGDTVIGYGGMWVLFEESHITNVAIAPEYRGNGYGRALMLELMRTAKSYKAERMTLEVREHNTVAQAMYFSLGFSSSGRRKGYYTDTGEDALILWNDDIAATIDTASAR